MKVEIKYNPYKMETSMLVDEVDVCQSVHYENFKRFIERGVPLQLWIEPIPYYDWGGFVDEIADPERNTEVVIIFSGRKIDFNDLKHSLKLQNKKRNKNKMLKLDFCHKEILDDNVLSKNIDDVVKELHSDWFKELVESRSSGALNEAYKELDSNYTRAKDSEFKIVFCGMYSSGKSTIINYLIKHRILPTSQATCTNRICRIRHIKDIGNKIYMKCFDSDDKQIFETEYFEDDESCCARFNELLPKNEDKLTEKSRAIETVELGVDLSHLYPTSVHQDKFTIVLIDTPGINSAKSKSQGLNKHEEITIDMVTDSCKPIVVFCVGAAEYENAKIGEFLSRLVRENKDEDAFKDRFLFLLNLADELSYDDADDDNIERRKKQYVSYLNNSDKWEGNNEGYNEDEEKASDFVPRVFFTSSLVAQAAVNGANNYTKEQQRTKASLKKEGQVLRDFIENVVEYDPENYYLSENCDIPEYHKEKIRRDFEKAIEDGDEANAALLQSGMLPLELAIKDYIERYAYPIKVKDLLGTFEALLSDVSAFSEEYSKKLIEAKESLGKNQSARKVVEEEKEDAENKNDSLEQAKKKTELQLEILNDIKFNNSKLVQARTEFMEIIDSDKTIEYIRANTEIVEKNTDIKKVEEKIDELLSNVSKVFDDANRKTYHYLVEVAENHEKQLRLICETLKNIVDDLESSGVLEVSGYKFSNNIYWKKNFEKLNTETLLTAMKGEMNESTQICRETNYKKLEWSLSRNPFKKLASVFMKSAIYNSVTVVSYSMEPIKHELSDHSVNLEKQCKSMQETYESELEKVKQNVKKLVEELFVEIKECQDDINKQNQEIKKLSNDIEKVSKVEKHYNDICKKLTDLSGKIKGV